jgi:hypothetical protein
MMAEYRYTLESCNETIAYDKNRRRSIETCPFCKKSNKDGKFVPYVGFNDRGHCFSCGAYSAMGKHTCPGCQAEKAFNRYIDTEENNQYLDPSVGKCLYCDYHYAPKQFFDKTHNRTDSPTVKRNVDPKPAPLTLLMPKPEPRSVSFIPVEVFKASLKGHELNHFVRFLVGLFGPEVTTQLISRYFIGTSKHWDGANVFWQIDGSGKIRTGKIMLYDPITGKRVKEPYSRIDWVHTVLKYPDYNMKQCLFGEHLLHDKIKPVALVESEKTAIIASAYLPQFIWLACGGKDGLNADKCKVLAGRNVILFPDISKPEAGKLTTFELWSKKATDISTLARFTVSDLLERKATEDERKQGLDLADYLVRFDPSMFIHTTPVKPHVTIPIVPAEPALRAVVLPNKDEASVKETFALTPVVKAVELIDTHIVHDILSPLPELIQEGLVNMAGMNRETWEMETIKDFFSNIEIPNGIKLNACTTIINPAQFLQTHFDIIEANNGNETFWPYYQRLVELRNLLSI